MKLRTRAAVAVSAAVTLLATFTTPAFAESDDISRTDLKSPVATGFGGAVATVDADATQVAIGVLRRGGDTGRHRTVLGRDRGRRLLRVLRRADPVGAHHRRQGDRAGLDQAGRV